jgi:hypothetical protein
MPEAGAGVEGERGGTRGHQSGDVVELRLRRLADADARRHHQFAAGQIRSGVGQLDGVRPEDLPIGMVRAGHQAQTQARLTSQPADGDHQPSSAGGARR